MSRTVLLWLLLLLLSLTSHQALAQGQNWVVSRSRAVKDQDINCRKKDSQGRLATFCQECGGVAAVALKCQQDPNCKGFSMENYDCGYLKTRADQSVQQDQPGFATFCKSGAGYVCRGDYIANVDYEATTNTYYSCNFKKEGRVQAYCQAEGNFNALMDECDRNVGGRCDGFVVPEAVNGRSGLLIRVPGGGRVVDNLVRVDGAVVFAKSSTHPQRSGK